MFEIRGEIRSTLRRSLPLPARPVRAAFAAFAVVLLNRHLQPRLDEAEHPSVAHAPGNALHQFGMRYLTEVVGQVAVDHLLVPRVQECWNRTTIPEQARSSQRE